MSYGKWCGKIEFLVILIGRGCGRDVSWCVYHSVGMAVCIGNRSNQDLHVCTSSARYVHRKYAYGSRGKESHAYRFMSCWTYTELSKEFVLKSVRVWTNCSQIDFQMSDYLVKGQHRSNSNYWHRTNSKERSVLRLAGARVLSRQGWLAMPMHDRQQMECEKDEKRKDR